MMKAIIFEQPGNPEEVLRLVDVPLPHPEDEQVLIKVDARPIQPADFLFIGGKYRIKPVYPQAAGIEGMGTIVECGPGVTRLKAGDRVAFLSPGGAWAELAVAPAARVFQVPAGVSDEAASQFALNPHTAWGLLAECNLVASNRILITAGRSVVARVLVELARRRDLEATLLVREDSGYAALNSLNHHVLAKGATVAGTLRALNATEYFNAIVDAVGGADSLTLIDALKPGGRLISYGVLDDGEFVLKASRILYKNMIWQGFGISGWLDNASQSQLEKAQQELWEMLSANPDLMAVTGRFELSRFREALRLTRDRPQPGKVLLVN